MADTPMNLVTDATDATNTTDSTDTKTPHYMVRLAFRVRPDAVSDLGYLFPAACFATGEHAERFGMCLWATRHRNVVALHVFPPISGRSLAPDGWSIAEPVHVDCGASPGARVPAIVVAPGGAMWLQEASHRVRAMLRVVHRRAAGQPRDTNPRACPHTDPNTDTDTDADADTDTDADTRPATAQLWDMDRA